MKKKSNLLENMIHGLFLLLGLITVGCVLVISGYLVISGIPAIRDCKNVWCDNSGGSFFKGDDMNYTLENISPERVLFGTDMPGCCGSNIGQILGADLTDAERELIFYKNAQKILDTNFRL